MTIDALLTWTQALSFNLPRISNRVDGALVAVGVAAPTVAAGLLWRAVRQRSKRTRAPRPDQRRASPLL